MTTFKGWFSSFVSGVLLASSALGADFSYELSPSIIEPGQRAILELRLARKPGDQTAVVQDTFLTKSRTLKILESDYDDSGETLIWRYQLTSYEPGTFSVPPVELKYGPATYSTEAQTLSVVSGRGPQDMNLRPAFGKVSLPINWSRWFPWLLLLLAVAIGYPLYRRFFKPRFSRWLANPSLGLFLHSPSEDPHQWLARQIRRIRSNIERSRGEQFWLDDLTDVLREYFSRQYGRPARSWTLAEMDREMGTIPAVRDILKEVFQRSDQLRFSGDPHQKDMHTVLGLLEHSEKALLRCGS